jgi:hypothetical protein
MQNFITINPTFSTWMIHIIHTLLDYHSIKCIWHAHISINIISLHVLELGLNAYNQINLIFFKEKNILFGQVA